MSGLLLPKQIAQQEHLDYYALGGYGEDRLRWTVASFLSDCSGKRILEIGCGDGQLLSMLRPRNEVFGIDVSQTGVDKCKAKGIAASCLDVSMEWLPFPDEHFDVVIILETLEHLMSPYYAIQETRRVLKDNATLLCSVPNPLTGHVYLYPGLFQYRYFRRFLEQCGFKILRVEPWQWVHRETILPRLFRGIAPFRSRYVAGVLRRATEKCWRGLGLFPWFVYWLWTFQCMKVGAPYQSPLTKQARQTRPLDAARVGG